MILYATEVVTAAYETRLAWHLRESDARRAARLLTAEGCTARYVGVYRFRFQPLRETVRDLLELSTCGHLRSHVACEVLESLTLHHADHYTLDTGEDMLR